jgi:hypothetical protein
MSLGSLDIATDRSLGVIFRIRIQGTRRTSLGLNLLQVALLRREQETFPRLGYFNMVHEINGISAKTQIVILGADSPA